MEQIEDEQQSNVQNESELPTETSYDGRDDQRWMNCVKGMDPDKEDGPLYETLVDNVGIYRWQNTSALSGRRSLSHLKPKFKNIKEFGLYLLRCILSVP